MDVDRLMAWSIKAVNEMQKTLDAGLEAEGLENPEPGSELAGHA